jgi:4-hydroxy-tetrahydrodipicolinate synthase
MDSTGAVDYEALERLVDWHVASGTDGLVIAGTTGESATLEKAEHVDVIRASVEYAAGRIPIIAGTGSNDTRQTVELSRAVDKIDISGFLVVTPYYNKPPQDGLYMHFREVATAVDHPVVLYNVPGRTSVDLLPETVGRLAELENIVGLKDATGEVARVARHRALCGDDFLLHSGDDATSREFMLAGGDGVITVTGNVCPREMAELCRLCAGGDAHAAATLDAGLAGLHDKLFVEANPIPVKWVLARLGRIGPTLRLPLRPLAEEWHETVLGAMRQARVIE